jgi:hypothetical protein
MNNDPTTTVSIEFPPACIAKENYLMVTYYWRYNRLCKSCLVYSYMCDDWKIN